MSAFISNLDSRDGRSHAEVIKGAGATRLHRWLVARGFELAHVSTVQRWGDRDSIPGEFWKALSEGGFATLDELSAYAEARKLQTGEVA